MTVKSAGSRVQALVVVDGGEGTELVGRACINYIMLGKPLFVFHLIITSQVELFCKYSGLFLCHINLFIACNTFETILI